MKESFDIVFMCFDADEILQNFLINVGYNLDWIKILEVGSVELLRAQELKFVLNKIK